MVTGLLQSDARVEKGRAIYHRIRGILVKLYWPEQARKQFKGRFYISKPTFYRWLKDGKIKKTAHPSVNANDYVISDEEIERVKKLMTRNWRLGRAKIPKV